MRPLTVLAIAAVVATGLVLGGAARSAPPQAQSARLLADGTLEMAGQRMRCADVETRLDRRLPNLGAASPGEGMLWINPRLLAEETPTVRLFVFHHECGHHHVGASELGSDCWAVGEGVAAGWLDRQGLQEVCDSFGGAPESSTHPSATRRCANLDRCFAAATEKKRQQTPVEVAAVRRDARVEGTAAVPAGTAVSATVAVAPQLKKSPTLLWTGEAP